MVAMDTAVAENRGATKCDVNWKTNGKGTS